MFVYALKKIDPAQARCRIIINYLPVPVITKSMFGNVAAAVFLKNLIFFVKI
jgi:hypothetical protein